MSIHVDGFGITFENALNYVMPAADHNLSHTDTHTSIPWMNVEHTKK